MPKDKETMASRHTIMFIRFIIVIFLAVFSFGYPAARAQVLGNTQDPDSLFQACEAIIDKSLDNVLKDLVQIKAENKELKKAIQEYEKMVEEIRPEKISGLETEMKKLQGKIEGYKTSLSDSISRIDVEIKKNAKLQHALKELTDQISALRIEYNTLLEKNASLKQVQYTQKKTIDGLNATITRLKSTLLKKEDEVSTLKSHRPKSSENTVQLLRTEVERYQGLLAEKEKRIDNYRSQFSQKEKTIDSLKEEFDILKSQYQELINMSQSSQSKQGENQQIILGLKGELLRIKERLSQKEALLAQTEGELNRLKNETQSAQEALQNEINRYKALLTTKEAELNQYTGDLKGTTFALKEERRKLNEFTKKLDSTQEEKNALMVKNKRLQEESDKVSSDYTTQLKVIAELKEEITSLRRRLDNEKDTRAKGIDRSQENKTALLQLKKLLAQHENQARRDKQDLKDNAQTISRLKAREEDLIAQHNQLKNSLAQLQSSTQNQSKDISSLNQSTETLRTQIRQKNDTIKSLNDEIQRIKREQTEASLAQKENIQKLKTEVARLENTAKTERADEIQSLQTTIQKHSDTIAQLETELRKTESQKEAALAQIEALSSQQQKVRDSHLGALEEAQDTQSELAAKIADLNSTLNELKGQHAKDMQSRQNKINELEKELKEKDNLITSLQSKIDQYAQIIPEGQLRKQEKCYLKTKELKNTINEYKKNYEQCRAETNTLRRKRTQNSGEVVDLEGKIQSLEQENLDLLKEAEALNKTIYSLGLGSELQRTKELATTRQQRQEKQYARELKEYAQQVDTLRQTTGQYEVAVGELLTLLDTLEIKDSRYIRHINELKKTLQDLQSRTW